MVGIGGSLRAIHIIPIASNALPVKFDGNPPQKILRGEIVANILKAMETDVFAFANPSEIFFSDHFIKLASAIKRNKEALMGISISVSTSVTVGKNLEKVLQEDEDDRLQTLLQSNQPMRDTGRFLFDSRLGKAPPENLFKLLDNSEHIFFQTLAAVSGPIARTFQPTLDRDLQMEAGLPIVDEHERRFIKDYFAFQPDWLRASAASVGASTEQSSQKHQAGLSRSTSHEFPLMVPNRSYEMKAGADGLVFLSDGFSDPETNFTWCLERGIIDFSLPDVRHVDAFSFVFRLALTARASFATGRPQHISVGFNGMIVGYYATTGADQTLGIILPIFKLPVGNRFRLELIPDHAEPVYSHTGDILDPRLLSFRIASCTLEQTPYVNAPLINAGETLTFSKTGLGKESLVQGFYKPEERFVWIAGTRGRVQVYLHSRITKGKISLSVRSRPSLASGDNQCLTVTMNGKCLGTSMVPCEDDFECRFKFGPGPLEGGIIDLLLELSHAEAVFDRATHEILDPRLLGLALISLTIVEDEEEASGD